MAVAVEVVSGLAKKKEFATLNSGHVSASGMSLTYYMIILQIYIYGD